MMAPVAIRHHIDEFALDTSPLEGCCRGTGFLNRNQNLEEIP